MTSLLDMVKETRPAAELHRCILKSPTAYETMNRAFCDRGCCCACTASAPMPDCSAWRASALASPPRIWLMSGVGISTPTRCAQAIAIVTNGTLRARNPAIWGDGTTACASDSKHFGAWDQNLTTQWHVRYGGRGVMIYWHVERNSLCIHSQLKSPSSSEVASMIEGVVHHCTEMEVDRQYVDRMARARSPSPSAGCWGSSSCRG